VALVRNILRRLARTKYVRDARANPVELSALRRRPTKRVWFGIFLAVLSYTIGWPVILLLGYLAYRLHEPLVVAIGGPLMYGISHLTFLAGTWFAGSAYVPTFMRWATRKAFERFLGPAAETTVATEGEEASSEASRGTSGDRLDPP
jgi:hypothetical protein